MSCCTICATNGDYVLHGEQSSHCDKCLKYQKYMKCQNCNFRINFWKPANNFNELVCCLVCAANGKFMKVPCNEHCDQCILSTKAGEKRCTGCKGMVNFFIRPNLPLPTSNEGDDKCVICESNGEIRFNCKSPHCPDCYVCQALGKKKCTSCKCLLNMAPLIG